MTRAYSRAAASYDRQEPPEAHPLVEALVELAEKVRAHAAALRANDDHDSADVWEQVLEGLRAAEGACP